jgi:hypothetical protein
MVRKIYKKLTKEQINKGVVFSSTLSTQKTEMLNDTTHEVFKTESPQEQEQHIKRLKDDNFFNASHFKYNIVRT